MRRFVVILFCFGYTFLFAQEHNVKKEKEANPVFSSNIKIEDRNGRLITDPILRQAYLSKRQTQLDSIAKAFSRSAIAQTGVPLCTNGSFEEFETVGGGNILKNYKYTTGEPLNPMQCQSVSANAGQGVTQYDPFNTNLMASTVPANHLDEYIGNINAFDQFCLKVNYKDSSPSNGIVQAKRYKTDNETILKFNYKAVLQTIFDSGHFDEQPYFKVRVINNSGSVVSEFCLIGDTENCIFTQAPVLEGGSVVLYTPNWQSGILDISSIPNNEEFTVEFVASRCGLNGHFGYAYIDDICILHSNENLQGSIELDPLYQVCPTLPINVCGDFTIPNSGGISATVTSVVLEVRDAANTVVYTSQTPTTLDLTTKRFCFELQAASFPDIVAGTYNIGVTINYGILQTNCSGTNFTTTSDDDANPGWDVWFLNCTDCDVPLQTASLFLCDTNHDGKEFFNLSNADALITTTAGLTFTYFKTLADATGATNPIANFTNYESSSGPVFIRATLNATCYRIIAIDLVVKNPSASISGILNVCSGSTVLTASVGASYLWQNGATTRSISVSAVGTYSVTVTDTFGCTAIGTVTILNNLIAVQPTIVITQPTCFVSTGMIEVTSPASEYSYDGGTTWVTTSSMSNLVVGTYLVKIRTAAGCTSYNTTINIVPFLSSFPSFTSVDPTFCGDVGSITITTPAAEYSFDDGLTWTTNNTMGNLLSGTYLIRVKDSFGCISNFNSVVLFGEFLPDPDYIKNNPYCGQPGSITITTPAAAYSFDGGTTWQTSNTLGNLFYGSYLIKIRNAQGCTSSNVYVYLYNFENSYPDYILNDAGCGVYASITITTPGDFYSFDNGVTWTTDPTALNLTTGVTYKLKVRKGLTCSSYSEYVTVYSSYKPIPLATDYATTLCDAFNDGSENVDLTLYQSNLIASSSSYTYKYYTTPAGAELGQGQDQITNYTACNLSNGNNKVYVRVISNFDCYKVVELQFSFIDSPIINMHDRYPLCEFKNVFIDAHAGYDAYLWSTSEITQAITLRNPDDYWVTVYENHITPTGLLVCELRKDFEVFLSNPATITKIIKADWSVDDNSMIIKVDGLGIYEYSLDGINYQDSNTFSHLKSGDYKVYVRDKYNCGVVDEEVFLLMYPYYFTPNDDTYNDTWKINLSEFEKGLTIKIFDRNGKFLKELGNDVGWDGMLNGEKLPATDYWFIVTRANGKEHRGHFTLKR